MFSSTMLRSVARVVALGATVAAVQLAAPAANANPYPNSVPTVTNLTLTNNMAQFGTRTRATVTVKPAGNANGTPRGRIRLVIHGVKTMSSRLSNGRTAFTLPRRALVAENTYGLKAFYIRGQGSKWMNSEDSAFYSVSKANTIAKTEAGNIKAHRRPLVSVNVRSSTGLTPNGRVRFQILKHGDVRGTRTVSLHNGRASVKFGKVHARGRWVAKATYLGAHNFERDADTNPFRVTR